MLNNRAYIILFLFFFFSLRGFCQPNTFPYESKLLTKAGDTISTKDLEIVGPVMLEFWNMSCGPCINFLDQVAQRYDEWMDSTQTKIVAIVSPGLDPITPNFVEYKNWPFPVYYDTDFKFYKQLSKAYNGRSTIEGFPTAYIFDKELRLVDKLANVKRKSSRLPGPGEELTKEMLAIDFEYYYRLSRKWNKK